MIYNMFGGMTLNLAQLQLHVRSRECHALKYYIQYLGSLHHASGGISEQFSGSKQFLLLF